jgi:hypothetical protein
MPVSGRYLNRIEGVMSMNGPIKLKRAVIKEEYVALTGSVDKALILNQFVYWSERVRDFDLFVKEEK